MGRYLGVKIAIIGAGLVGATTAFALMQSGLASELVLVDTDQERAKGEAMDLAHAAAFVPPVEIRPGDYRDCLGADIVIFTAGYHQHPGQTRQELVHANTRILAEALPPILEAAPQAIVLMVTNPVDVLTYVGLKISGLPPERLFGSGTTLDTSRFRHLLSRHCRVDARNVHAYIVGEHGDTEVPVWSLANIAGVAVQEYCLVCQRNCLKEDKDRIFEQVKNAAYTIIERKKATYYAIALAVRRICESIIRDENSILTVTGMISGMYGLDDVCLSLPSLVNRRGRTKVLELPLSEDEKAALLHSARSLHQVIDQLERPFPVYSASKPAFHPPHPPYPYH
ncbi:MAG: L-lactate dehydrogenase [Firmicutes bacterium]|nr:L-lactate dehydrogenase [Bacillota bacterium]